MEPASPELPLAGTIGRRITRLQDNGEGSGTIDRPTTSRPLFVNLRLEPKEIVPLISRTLRRGTQRSTSGQTFRSDGPAITNEEREVTSVIRDQSLDEREDIEWQKRVLRENEFTKLEGLNFLESQGFGYSSESDTTTSVSLTTSQLNPRFSVDLSTSRSLLPVAIWTALPTLTPTPLPLPTLLQVPTSTFRPITMAGRNRCRYPSFRGMKGDAESFLEDFEA